MSLPSTRVTPLDDPVISLVDGHFTYLPCLADPLRLSLSPGPCFLTKPLTPRSPTRLGRLPASHRPLGNRSEIFLALARRQRTSIRMGVSTAWNNLVEGARECKQVATLRRLTEISEKKCGI